MAIRTALDAADSGGLARAVHSLKSSVGNFKAEAAFQAALQLEEAGRNTDLELAQQVWISLQRK